MRIFSLFILALFIAATTNVVAQQQSSTTLGGYGELHYNEPDGHKRGKLDFHRFVLFVGHRFNDHVSFMSEIELEHTLVEAGNPKGGYLLIEQAFLDYHVHKNIGVRAGILLIPVGLLNLYHEPPTFNGVERTNVERNIIPTTWSEAGIGIYGNPANSFHYQLFVVAGLKADDFTSSSGFRGGRQRGFESNPANPSFTGRLDFSPAMGLQLGASFYVGNASADIDSIGSASVALWSTDLRYRIGDFSFKALGAIGTIGDATMINKKFGKSVADKIFGYYIEGSYNVLSLLCPESEHTLDLFARYEKYNTQAATTGFPIKSENNRNDIVFGLTYKPTFNTALKFDYTLLNNALNAGTSINTSQLNIGIGYYFF